MTGVVPAAARPCTRGHTDGRGRASVLGPAPRTGCPRGRCCEAGGGAVTWTSLVLAVVVAKRASPLPWGRDARTAGQRT